MASFWSPPDCARGTRRGIGRRRRGRWMRSMPRRICGPRWRRVGVPMDALMVSADAPGFYHPGRSGVVRQGPKTVLGSFGELHPRVLAALDMTGPVVAFAAEPGRRAGAETPPPRRAGPAAVPAGAPRLRLPGGCRVTADAVLRAARGAERALIAGVSLFDVYAGRKTAGGQEVAGDRGGVPAARTHADRRGDRGGVPEGYFRRCESDRGGAAVALTGAPCGRCRGAALPSPSLLGWTAPRHRVPDLGCETTKSGAVHDPV